MHTMASSTSPKTTKKHEGKGKSKIEIKKVEQASKRLVTFSKRKLGLFRKASELSLLCDSHIAVIVFSQQNKVYSSGYPNPDTVINRYLSGASSSGPTTSELSSLRQEHEEAMKVLEKEKEFHKHKVDGPGSWWDGPIEEMGLEEVMHFKECVEKLRDNVVAAAEEKKDVWLIGPPVTTAAESMYISLLNDEVLAIDDQIWECLGCK